MKNPFKNNPLASGLLGFILGAGTMAGGQALFGGGGNDGVASGLETFPVVKRLKRRRYMNN